MTTPPPDVFTDDDKARLLAGTEVVHRTGGDMRYGFHRDNVPAAEAGWWAEAVYRNGKRLRVDEPEHTSPIDAVEELARRLLTGGRCIDCAAVVTLHLYGAVIHADGTQLDGTPGWTEETARKAGECLWRRVGPSYQKGCQALSAEAALAMLTEIDAAPQPTPTHARLAAALIGADAPAGMVFRALGGYYDDVLSELMTPTRTLVQDLRDVGLHRLAVRARAGEWHATKAEFRTWLDTDEGRRAVALFGDNEIRRELRDRLRADPTLAEAVLGEVLPAARGGASWTTPRPGAKPDRKRGRNR